MDRLADTLREALRNLKMYDGEVTVVMPKGLPAASATALIDVAREFGREVIISPLMEKDTVGLMGKGDIDVEITQKENADEGSVRHPLRGNG